MEIVPGGSELGEEVNASFLGIAEEPVLAGVARFNTPQAWRRLPFALPKEEWSIAVTQERLRSAWNDARAEEYRELTSECEKLVVEIDKGFAKQAEAHAGRTRRGRGRARQAQALA